LAGTGGIASRGGRPVLPIVIAGARGQMASVVIKVVSGKVVFDPNPLRVTPGAFVVWNNQTTEIHQILIASPTFRTDDIASDDVSDPQFNVTRPVGTTITYTCSRHTGGEGEKGTIEVI
jgi:plastocyanin